jgi:hypothetical protein
MSTPNSTEALAAILKILEKSKTVLHPGGQFTEYGWNQLGHLFNILGIDKNDDTFVMHSDFLVYEGKKFVRCSKTDRGYSWSIEVAAVDMFFSKKDFLRMEDGNYVFKRNRDTIFIDASNISNVKSNEQLI